MSLAQRCFAVIPAAGRSSRMGTPKLSLPLGNATVIEHVLAELDDARIVDRAVVVRHDQTELLELLAGLPVRIVTPRLAPPDMRSSVQIALDELQKEQAPQPDEPWLLIPADAIGVQRRTVGQLLDEWFDGDTDTGILVPACKGKRGHPTIFRWSLVERLRALPEDFGVNALLRDPSIRVRELAVKSAGVLGDLDTPQDYQRVSREFSATSRQIPPGNDA